MTSIPVDNGDTATLRIGAIEIEAGVRTRSGYIEIAWIGPTPRLRAPFSAKLGDRPIRVLRILPAAATSVQDMMIQTAHAQYTEGN